MPELVETNIFGKPGGNGARAGTAGAKRLDDAPVRENALSSHIDLIDLSEREREILRLVATGASNKEIASQLQISVNTVRVHLRNIFTKIGVTSRTEATLYAIRTNLVQIEHPPALAADPAVTPPIAELVTPAPAADLPPVPRPALQRRWIAALAVALIVVLVLALYSVALPRTAQTTAASPIPADSTRWRERAALPTARSGLAVAALDNYLYAIGGEGAQISGATERYDPRTNTWVELAAKPTTVTDIAAAVLRGRIYVPGGRLPSGSMTNVLEAYDPRTNRWETEAPLPAALSAYTMVAFEGRLLVFGGTDGERTLATVYEYDPGQNTWRTRASMPTARRLAGAATAGGRIFVVGGQEDDHLIRANEEYLPERDNSVESPWVSRRPLPAGRAGMGVASLADIVHVVGGISETENPPSLKYLPQSDEWQTFDSLPSPARSRIGAVAQQPYLYLMGGSEGSAPTAVNLSYQAIFTIMVPSFQSPN